ncbi:MAG: hypothetical protein WCU88_10715, partial [Elusimicrobiota bacterium]
MDLRGMSRGVEGFLKTGKPCRVLPALALALTAVSSFAPSLARASNSEAVFMYNRLETKGVSRVWTGASFDAELLSKDIPGSEANIQWAKIVAAPPGSPRSGERVAVILDDNGKLWAQVFDGTSWGNEQTLKIGLQTQPGLNYRSFDVAYEWSGSNVIVAYSDATQAATRTNVRWRRWDGTAWSAADQTFDDYANTSGNAVRWVRLEAQPKTDSQVMVVLFADTSGELWGQSWDGNAWTRANTTGLTGSYTTATLLESSVYRDFDLAFTSASGVAYVVIGSRNSGAGGILEAVTYTPGTGWAAGTDSGDMEGGGSEDFNWIFLAADPAPGSNNIALAGIDQGRDLSLATWNGSAWVNTLLDAEPNCQTYQAGQAIDLTFEESSGRAMVSYAIVNDATPRYRLWTSAGGWGNANSASAADNGNGSNANIQAIQLFREAGTDNLQLFAENNYGNLMHQRWNATGGSGSGAFEGSASQVAAMVSGGGTANSLYRVGYCYANDMLFYARNDENIPYKRWDTSAWSSGDTPSVDIDGVPFQVIVRGSPKRDEKTAVFVDNNGDVNSLIWNGSSWGYKTEHTDSLDVANSNNIHKAADAAYERKIGDALIVFANNGAIPQFQTRGVGATSWSSAQSIPGWSGTGTPLFIRLQASPNADSNGILLAVQDTNNDLFSAYWDGSSWSKFKILETSISQNGAGETRAQCFDVAWTSNGVKGMVAWSNSLPATPYTPFYRIWYSTATDWALTTSTAPDIDAATGQIPRYIQLSGDLSSQRIGMAVSGNNNYLTAMIWDGDTEAWGNVQPAAETALNEGNNGYRAFDIAWEPGGGKLLLFSAVANGAVRYRYYTTGGTWNAAAYGEVTDANVRAVQAVSDPNDPASKEIFVAILNQNRQLRTYQWNGTLQPPDKPTPLYAGYPWRNYYVEGEPFCIAYTRDSTAPVSGMIAPLNGVHYNLLDTINGTANDDVLGAGKNVSDIVRVEVEIQDLFNDQYYKLGSGWQAAQVWNTATGKTPWSISGLSAIWTATRPYRVRVRAIDNAGNIQENYTTSDFVYDTANPTGDIVYPQDMAGLNGYYRSHQLTTLNGTAGDTSPGEVYALVFKLRRYLNFVSDYWNPKTETWGGTEIAFSTVACGVNCWNSTIGVWKSTFPRTAWTDGATYYFSVQVEDKAQNWRTTGSTHAFVVDETTPAVSFNFPGVEEGSYRTFAAVAGKSLDSFPVRLSSVSIQDMGTNNCWGGTAFDKSCPYWVDAAPAAAWSYTFPSGSYNNYRLKVLARAEDAAGNYVESGAEPSRLFRVDNSSPSSTTGIPVLDSWRRTLTQIQGTATDNPNGHINEVWAYIYRYKDHLYWNGSGWGASPTSIKVLDDRNNNTDFSIGGLTFSQSWHMDFTDSNWALKPDGVTYYTPAEISGASFTITAQAYDRARGYDAAQNPGFCNTVNDLCPNRFIWTMITPTTFYWDVSAPTTTVRNPAHMGSLGQGATVFSGGYYDANSGVNRVEYLLQRESDKKYWGGGSSWGTDPPANNNWEDALIYPTSWTVTGPNFQALDSGTSYTLYVRSCDNTGLTANNNCADAAKQTNLQTVITSETFKVDAAVPQSRVQVPSSQQINRLPVISGTSYDFTMPLAWLTVQISSGCPGACRYWDAVNKTWIVTQTSAPATTLDGGNGDWTYTVPPELTFKDGVEYIITPHAADTIGNDYDGISSTFTFDVSWPTGTVNVPVGGRGHSSVNTISGIGADNLPGVPYQVSLSIRKGSQWWDPNGTQGPVNSFNIFGSTIWFSLSGSDSWSYNSSGVPWENGTEYLISVRIRDFAGNETGQPLPGSAGTGSAPISVVFDTDKPDSRILSLADGSHYGNLPGVAVSGTASDFVAGVGAGLVKVSAVQFHLSDQIGAKKTYDPDDPDPSDWIDGDLTDDSHWQDAVYTPYVGGSSGTWTYSLPAAGFTNGNVYRMVVRAKDSADMWQANYSTVTVTYDYSKPASGVLVPADGYYTKSALTEISGTATDNVIVQNSNGAVKLRLLRLESGTTRYWTGTGWGDPPGIGDFSSLPSAAAVDGTFNSNSEPWRFDTNNGVIWNTPNVRYWAAAIAQDKASNQETALSTTTFGYDTALPTTSVQYPVNSGSLPRGATFFFGGYYDNFSGVNRVEYQFQRQSDGKYWDGGAWGDKPS